MLRSLKFLRSLVCLTQFRGLQIQDMENNNGYLQAPSSAQAEKISMVAESWERLITNKSTQNTTSLSLTVHRITGSKEAITLLHHFGVGISYNDARLIINYWASCNTLNHRGMLPPGFSSNESIHITFDNSDGRQQTITGSQTTDHTTCIIFQVKSDNNSNIQKKELC